MSVCSEALERGGFGGRATVGGVSWAGGVEGRGYKRRITLRSSKCLAQPPFVTDEETEA